MDVNTDVNAAKRTHTKNEFQLKTAVILHHSHQILFSSITASLLHFRS